MKLRNRKSYMTSLPEGKPPENIRPRITQIIYYMILVFILGYVIYIFSSRALYFSEHGFVEVDKTIISSSQGGKVIKLPVKEGQKLQQGELMATIAASRNCGGINDTRVNKLNYDLALNRTKLSFLKREINTIKSQLEQSSLQRALETGQASDSISSKLNYDLLKKQNEAALLDSQIILQQQQVKPSVYAGSLSSSCINENLIAPFNGYIHSVKRNLNEYTALGKPLLILVKQDARVRIEAYLNNEQLPYLKIGDLVDITFADGIETEAKIENIYSSAFNAPEREWNHYKPLDTQVRVHLEPLNKHDATIWKKYDRMEVSVRGRK